DVRHLVLLCRNSRLARRTLYGTKGGRLTQTVPLAAGVPTDFEGPSIVEPVDDVPRDDRYLRLLLWLLVSAAFFEGYDSSILSLLLPNIQNTFHVSEAVLGITRIPIELGLFVAFFVTRLSDRLGRRPLLLWSVVGYPVFTALTAFS